MLASKWSALYTWGRGKRCRQPGALGKGQASCSEVPLNGDLWFPINFCNCPVFKSTQPGPSLNLNHIARMPQPCGETHPQYWAVNLSSAAHLGSASSLWRCWEGLGVDLGALRLVGYSLCPLAGVWDTWVPAVGSGQADAALWVGGTLSPWISKRFTSFNECDH